MEAPGFLMPRIDGLPGSPLSDLWIKPYSGPVLVVISMVCTALLILFSMPIVFSLGIGCALFLVLFKNYPHQIMHTRMSEASILSLCWPYPFSFWPENF